LFIEVTISYFHVLLAQFDTTIDSPMTVHAEFAVLVMEQDTPISALTMVRLSRLAKSLKKNLVLASGTPHNVAPPLRNSNRETLWY